MAMVTQLGPMKIFFYKQPTAFACREETIMHKHTTQDQRVSAMKKPSMKVLNQL